MKIIFMGTGTSQGVPVIGGSKHNPDLTNPRNWRNRSCAHIEVGGLKIQIDAGPEFRLQCLQNDISCADIFILTHGHSDHIAGMDDLRRFCDKIDGNVLPVYSNPYGIERIKAMFPYALGDKPASVGYPCFRLMEMPKLLELSNGVKIKSASLPHGPVETLGVVIEGEGKKAAYYTDCHSLTPEAVEIAKNADVAVLDCLKITPHPSHMNLETALDAAKKLDAKLTYFTHMTSHIDYGVYEPKLPKNVHFAYDGMNVIV